MNSEILSLGLGELGTWCLRLVFSLTVLWLTTGLTVWLMRRSSAALRHRIWALSVLVAIAIPVLIIGLPSHPLGWIAAPPDQAQRELTSTLSTDSKPVTIPVEQSTGMGFGNDPGFPGIAGQARFHLPGSRSNRRHPAAWLRRGPHPYQTRQWAKGIRSGTGCPGAMGPFPPGMGASVPSRHPDQGG